MSACHLSVTLNVDLPCSCSLMCCPTDACTQACTVVTHRKIVFVYSEYSPSGLTCFTATKWLFFLCNFHQSSKVFFIQIMSTRVPLHLLYVFVFFLYVCILERRVKKCLVEENLLEKMFLMFWKCIGGKIDVSNFFFFC